MRFVYTEHIGEYCCLSIMNLLHTLLVFAAAIFSNDGGQVVTFPVSRFQVSSNKLLDLSYPFDSDTVYWPTTPSFNLTSLQDHYTEKGYYYRVKWLSTGEHGGTHLDAPNHFAEKGFDASQIPLDGLSGPVVVLNVSTSAGLNPDYEVTVQDVLDWEALNGFVPNGSIIMMNSGWGAKWPDKQKVFGTTTPADPKTFHFPGFHPNATKLLIELRNIRGIGVDTPSTDHGQSQDYGTHIALSLNGLIGLENVANLDLMPSSGAHVIVAPMKIANGSGGPARIFGIIPNV